MLMLPLITTEKVILKEINSPVTDKSCFNTSSWTCFLKTSLWPSFVFSPSCKQMIIWCYRLGCFFVKIVFFLELLLHRKHSLMHLYTASVPHIRCESISRSSWRSLKIWRRSKSKAAFLALSISKYANTCWNFMVTGNLFQRPIKMQGLALRLFF